MNFGFPRLFSLFSAKLHFSAKYCPLNTCILDFFAKLFHLSQIKTNRRTHQANRSSQPANQPHPAIPSVWLIQPIEAIPPKLSLPPHPNIASSVTATTSPLRITESKPPYFRDSHYLFLSSTTTAPLRKLIRKLCKLLKCQCLTAYCSR